MVTLENTQKIVPFLWFDNNAEEAADFYCSLFKNAKVTMRSPLVVGFELEGMKFMGLNGGPQFKPNEAFSIYVNCEDQQEVDALWNKLTSDGGEEGQCGWLKDKYGFSWQIVPTLLSKLMSDPDREKSQRVMDAMLKMRKMDMAELQAAFDGN